MNEKNWMDMTIDGWDSHLRGEDFKKVPKEVGWAYFEERYLKRYIKAFETKFKRKLKYRIDGIAFISYEETKI